SIHRPVIQRAKRRLKPLTEIRARRFTEPRKPLQVHTTDRTVKRLRHRIPDSRTSSIERPRLLRNRFRSTLTGSLTSLRASLRETLLQVSTDRLPHRLAHIVELFFDLAGRLGGGPFLK